MMGRVSITLGMTAIVHQRKEEETDISLLHDHALENDIKIELEMITTTQAETETDLRTQQTTKIDIATHGTEMITLAQPEKDQKNEIGIQAKWNQRNLPVPLDTATTPTTQENQIVKSFSVA